MRPLKMKTKTDIAAELPAYTPPGYPHPVRLRRIMNPSPGIWYWTHFNFWELLEVKETEFGALSHADAWRLLVVPEIAKHYKLKAGDVKRLEPLYRSMPRGSVMYGANSKCWIIMHAQDNPMGQQKAEMLIPARFCLSNILLRGDVAFAHDKKLAMIPADQLALQAVIGTVPYITRKA
jgi:hypothetical protein